MSLYLYFFLAGCFCYSSNAIPEVTVMQNKVATLPCPCGKGNVTWSRFINGKKVTLVKIKNGVEERFDKRYGSLADNSLVIRNVTSSDSLMYLCNTTTVYLNVITDTNTVGPNAGNVTDRPRNRRLGPVLGPDQKGNAEDAENQQPSDVWKIPVGVVVGVALVLLLIFTLKFCFKNRMEKTTNLDETVPEVIYEEIKCGEEQPARESYFESPYYSTSIREMESTSTPPNNTLYSTVNKLTTKGRSSEECVYHLAQNPLKTGNVSE
ncbi:uncharacterized protein LOC129117002 isoform X1 [Anoplopoma fimbria]|uniref:uncharacterized protein LOC129117002 isoform X1 n=1 Tax=Anoplopoma fimbria TaxID=229290 RepID=UPI0023EA8EB1|nr:uncharacterized protein LOC129117002 isoform X1 [Anoplopoma fimbria]